MELRNVQRLIPQHLKLLQVLQAATSTAYSRTNPSSTQHPAKSVMFHLSGTSAGFTVRSFQPAVSQTSSVYSTTTKSRTPSLSTPTSKRIATSSGTHPSLTYQPTGAHMQSLQPIVRLTLLFLPTSRSSDPTKLRQQQKQSKKTSEALQSPFRLCRVAAAPRRGCYLHLSDALLYLYNLSLTFPALCRSEPHHISSQRQRSTFTIQNLSLVGGMTPLRLPQLTTGQ